MNKETILKIALHVFYGGTSLVLLLSGRTTEAVSTLRLMLGM